MYIDNNGYLCIDKEKEISSRDKFIVMNANNGVYIPVYETKKYKINKDGLFEEVI